MPLLHIFSFYNIIVDLAFLLILIFIINGTTIFFIYT